MVLRNDYAYPLLEKCGYDSRRMHSHWMAFQKCFRKSHSLLPVPGKARKENKRKKKCVL